MATDLNVSVIHGRLTSDAVHEEVGNSHLAKFAIAFGRNVKRNGQWLTETSYMDVDMWGNRGMGLKPYLTKGREVTVQGYIKQERWKAQDGTGRSRIKLVCDELQLGREPRSESQGTEVDPSQKEMEF